MTMYEWPGGPKVWRTSGVLASRKGVVYTGRPALLEWAERPSVDVLDVGWLVSNIADAPG